MRYFIVLAFSLNAMAFNVDEYVNSLRDQVQGMFGNSKGKDLVEHNFKMPQIPDVKKNPMATDVYKKEGAIYQTGESFNKLSVEEKRKYHYLFLEELVVSVRGAEATNEELAKFLNVLEQGGNREGIYRSIVYSRDYQNLERYQEVPEDRVIEFGYDYGTKYLALQFNKKDMKRLNLWGIKRIITEKTLEIIDAFPRDGKDFYQWYALLSYDLSKTFDKVWRNKLRTNKNINYHHKWAQSVPYQQVKTEVIIKLHKVFNYLQNKTN